MLVSMRHLWDLWLVHAVPWSVVSLADWFGRDHVSLVRRHAVEVAYVAVHRHLDALRAAVLASFLISW